ncbi:MAG: DNA-directed RNA polymerase subunit omega [Acidobacteria bacterium]|jgi:hypothetical protein|nr:DNA-directed RNA polymerase subunit omega [Acidobacteriota bacterium]
MKTAVTGATAAGPAAPDVLLSDQYPPSRFHVATLAFFRAKQLNDGARPRVDGRGHRSWRVALLEVEAAQVSWYLE